MTNELYHFGVQGQEWHKRRYQNEDGSLTELGRQHYRELYGKKEKAASDAEKLKKKRDSYKSRVEHYKSHANQAKADSEAKANSKAVRKRDQYLAEANDYYNRFENEEDWPKKRKYREKAEKATQKASKYDKAVQKSMAKAKAEIEKYNKAVVSSEAYQRKVDQYEDKLRANKNFQNRLQKSMDELASGMSVEDRADMMDALHWGGSKTTVARDWATYGKDRIKNPLEEYRPTAEETVDRWVDKHNEDWGSTAANDIVDRTLLGTFDEKKKRR